MSKPIYLGKKIVFGLPPNMAEIRAAMPEAIKTVEFFEESHAVASGDRQPFIIEDTPTHWNLCPILKQEGHTTQADFQLFIAVPKPKPD